MTAPGGPPGACDRQCPGLIPEAARRSPGPCGWSRGVSLVELRPRHTERGTGVRGQGPAPARQGWPRSPTSRIQGRYLCASSWAVRPPSQAQGLGASPGARGEPSLTHQPPPARTPPGRPFQKAGSQGTCSLQGGAHRDLPLQRQGCLGLTSPGPGALRRALQKVVFAAPLHPPARARRATPPCALRAHTRPGWGWAGPAQVRAWPGKQDGREGAAGRGDLPRP